MLDNHGHVIEIERRIVSAAAAAETAEAASELEARLARAAAAEEEAARRVRDAEQRLANRSPTSSAGDRPQLGGAGQHHQERPSMAASPPFFNLTRAPVAALIAREKSGSCPTSSTSPRPAASPSGSKSPPRRSWSSSGSMPELGAGDARPFPGPAPSGW